MTAELDPKWRKEPAPLLNLPNERRIGEFGERYMCQPMPMLTIHVFQAVPSPSPDEKVIMIFDKRDGQTTTRVLRADGWLQAACMVYAYLEGNIPEINFTTRRLP